MLTQTNVIILKKKKINLLHRVVFAFYSYSFCDSEQQIILILRKILDGIALGELYGALLIQV